MLAVMSTLFFLFVLIAVVAVIVQLFRRKWKAAGVWGVAAVASFILSGVAAAAAGFGNPATATASASRKITSKPPVKVRVAPQSNATPNPYGILPPPKVWDESYTQEQELEDRMTHPVTTIDAVAGNPNKWDGRFVEAKCHIESAINVDYQTFSDQPAAYASCVASQDTTVKVVLVGPKVPDLDGDVRILGPAVGSVTGKDPGTGASRSFPAVQVDYNLAD